MIICQATTSKRPARRIIWFRIMEVDDLFTCEGFIYKCRIYIYIFDAHIQMIPYL